MKHKRKVKDDLEHRIHYLCEESGLGHEDVWAVLKDCAFCWREGGGWWTRMERDQLRFDYQRRTGLTPSEAELDAMMSAPREVRFTALPPPVGYVWSPELFGGWIDTLMHLPVGTPIRIEISPAEGGAKAHVAVTMGRDGEHGMVWVPLSEARGLYRALPEAVRRYPRCRRARDLLSQVFTKVNNVAVFYEQPPDRVVELEVTEPLPRQQRRAA